LNNIAGNHPGIVERLRGLVKDHLAAPEPDWGAPEKVPLSDMLLGQLRALGYMAGQDLPKDEQKQDAEGAGEPVE
jgi:hypothetical protein